MAVFKCDIQRQIFRFRMKVLFRLHARLGTDCLVLRHITLVIVKSGLWVWLAAECFSARRLASCLECELFHVQHVFAQVRHHSTWWCLSLLCWSLRHILLVIVKSCLWVWLAA